VLLAGGLDGGQEGSQEGKVDLENLQKEKVVFLQGK
jgi:hypothetical protein